MFPSQKVRQHVAVFELPGSRLRGNPAQEHDQRLPVDDPGPATLQRKILAILPFLTVLQLFSCEIVELLRSFVAPGTSLFLATGSTLQT